MDSTLPLIDSGASLTHRKFAKDIDSVIHRGVQSGLASGNGLKTHRVSKVVATASTLNGSKESLRLAHLFPGTVYATAGVHPHDAKAWEGEASADALLEILSKPECVALGVCGLDFNRDFSTPEKQIEAFLQQLEVARAANKPVIVHERNAHDEVLRLLTDHSKTPTVISCFSGSRAEAKAYIELDFFLALTGVLWKDKFESSVRQCLKEQMIPMDRVLLASDAPFLYPNTRASKLSSTVKAAIRPESLSYLDRYCTFQRNEPCSLPVTADMLAATIDQSPSQVAIATTMNALKVFGLSS